MCCLRKVHLDCAVPLQVQRYASTVHVSWRRGTAGFPDVATVSQVDVTPAIPSLLTPDAGTSAQVHHDNLLGGAHGHQPSESATAKLVASDAEWRTLNPGFKAANQNVGRAVMHAAVRRQFDRKTGISVRNVLTTTVLGRVIEFNTLRLCDIAPLIQWLQHDTRALYSTEFVRVAPSGSLMVHSTIYLLEKIDVKAVMAILSPVDVTKLQAGACRVLARTRCMLPLSGHDCS